jgi:hypothetical protein
MVIAIPAVAGTGAFSPAPAHYSRPCFFYVCVICVICGYKSGLGSKAAPEEVRHLDEERSAIAAKAWLEQT